VNKELSVIIPVYNEEHYIEKTAREVHAFLTALNYEFEVLLVNDGSTDKTTEIIERLSHELDHFHILDQGQNRGKGEAVQEGIRHAKYSLCLFMDADNATKIEAWPKFEKFFEQGFPVVIASRHLKESRIVKPQPWIRRFLGTGYRILCRLLFGIRVSDFNCGFKAYETDLAREIYSKTQMKDWTFDVEVLCMLRDKDCKIAEVPVQWTDRKPEDSSIKPVQTAFKTLKSIITLKRRFG